MGKISRRDFIKVSSLTLGGTLAGGLCGSRLALSMLQKTGEEGVAAGAEGVIPTMCHGCSYGGYNCGVLAHVKEGFLTRVEGNPHQPQNLQYESFE